MPKLLQWSFKYDNILQQWSFRHDNIFAKPHTKMTTLSRFSRQNDAGLGALNVVLWENLVLVVVLVLESKGPYWYLRAYRLSMRGNLKR